MFYFLSQFDLPFSNLFRYVTFRAGAAAAVAFFLSLLLGKPLIAVLRRRKAGQHVRTGEEMSAIAHGAKEGTPTMGGILIVSTTVLSTLLFGDLSNPPLWLVLSTMLAMGGIGFWDDLAKLRHRSSDGLSVKQKLLLQGLWMLAAFAAIEAIPSLAAHAEELMVPFCKTAVWTMPLPVAALFFYFVLVGTTNAVNLTDGLDGLAAGCSASALGVYAAFAYVAGHAALAAYLQIPAISLAHEVAIVCAAAAGACLGFLWWNAYPARVFMGDTGSEALGGLLAMAAIVTKQELCLLIVGALFLCEEISVMIQTGACRWHRWRTGEGLPQDKRPFLMTPLHHHCEILAKRHAAAEGRDTRSAENAVVVRFWILSIVAAVAGLATLKIR